MDKQIKQFKWNIKVLDQANRIIQMVGSNEGFDRVGDRIFMTGVNLDNYLLNPVILANHDYGSNEKATCIGKALSVSIQNNQLIFKIQFADTANGQEWFYLYANKFMNASSIGFIPISSTPNNQGGYDYTETELLELSLVAVPCNPTAVQRAFKDKKISKSLYEQIKNNESEVEDMKIEEIKALIATAVTESVKPLETKHAAEITDLETKLEKAQAEKGTGPNCTGCCCCTCTQTSCTGCTKTPNTNPDATKSFKTKSGAAISSANADVIKSVMAGMTDHVKTLKSLVDVSNAQDTDGDPDDGDTKEYSAKEIEKMVSDNVEKLIKEAK